MRFCAARIIPGSTVAGAVRWRLTGLALTGVLLAATVVLPNAHAQEAVVGAFAGTTTQAYVPDRNPVVIVDMVVAGFSAQLGQFTAVGQQTADLRTGAYTGSYTVTVATGDTLTATTTGLRLMCVSSGVYTLEERITITGGSGAFSGATGEGTGLGVFGSRGNEIALVFKATLSSASAVTSRLGR